MKVVLVFLALVVAQSAAHLCLLFPHQRGSEQNLNSAGSTDCYLLVDPCGNRSAVMPDALIIFKSGANVSIIFQKNLNHFYSAKPGSFNVKIAKYDSAGTEFTTTLLSIPDTDSPSLTLYTPFIVIPKDMTGHVVLQVTYVTGNPDAPPVFYQCADIMVM